MQTAPAASAHLHGLTPGSQSTPANSSYAPLYLTTSLSKIAFDIEELESISLNRLRLLKAVEAARTAASNGTRQGSVLHTIRTAIQSSERSHDFKVPPLGNRDRDKMIHKDEASHFLLRLALCKTHEHRAWFLQTEHDLFTSRLSGAGADFALRAIEKANGPVVEPVSHAEIERFHVELDAVARGPNRQKGDADARYFKISFEEVPSLVRHRRVFLHKGKAFVPERNVLDIVSAQFRSKLSGALAIASKGVTIAEGDKRMRPILESIRQHFAADDNARKGFDEANNVERISLAQLNESLPAMPICMTNMMAKLREQHHLRHSARMQLGVFLKGCGLTMDESLKFWRTEFGKGQIAADKFEKTYAYNIRHHYGKEGKRKNLAPFACIRVINERPGPGDHNGCPYREFEEGGLKTLLRRVGTDPNAIPAIVAKARNDNFQAACGMCFASSQPGYHAAGEHDLPEFIPHHPNEYFIEARRRRFAPNPPPNDIDDGIDDEDMLVAAAAVESPNSPSHSKREESFPEKEAGSASENPDLQAGKMDIATSD